MTSEICVVTYIYICSTSSNKTYEVYSFTNPKCISSMAIAFNDNL
jgi:hypothetical protein